MLDAVYDLYDEFNDKEFSGLEDREKSEVKFKVPVHLFENFSIKLAYIFKWCP